MTQTPNWKTTNVRLPEEDWRALKMRAVRENKSIARLIREAIEILLGKRRLDGGEAILREEAPGYGIVGVVQSGIADGSERHDDIVYGAVTTKNQKGTKK